MCFKLRDDTLITSQWPHTLGKTSQNDERWVQSLTNICTINHLTIIISKSFHKNSLCFSLLDGVKKRWCWQLSSQKTSITFQNCNINVNKYFPKTGYYCISKRISRDLDLYYKADLDLWGWRRMRKPYCLAELHKITWLIYIFMVILAG